MRGGAEYEGLRDDDEIALLLGRNVLGAPKANEPNDMMRGPRGVLYDDSQRRLKRSNKEHALIYMSCFESHMLLKFLVLLFQLADKGSGLVNLDSGS